MENNNHIQNKDEDDIINDFLDDIKDNPSNSKSNYLTSAKILSTNDEISKKLENKNKSADIYLKWVYGISIISILIAWEIFVIKFSMKQLNPCDKCVHKVSDAVFIALLTTATANILVLPTIVLKYLFPNGNKK